MMRCVYEACIVSCGVCQSRESRVQRLVEEDVEAGERIRGRLCLYRVVALFRFMYNLEQREDYSMSIYIYDGCAGLWCGGRWMCTSSCRTPKSEHRRRDR